jgi:hypothetical protein
MTLRSPCDASRCAPERSDKLSTVWTSRRSNRRKRWWSMGHEVRGAREQRGGRHARLGGGKACGRRRRARSGVQRPAMSPIGRRTRGGETPVTTSAAASRREAQTSEMGVAWRVRRRSANDKHYPGGCVASGHVPCQRNTWSAVGKPSMQLPHEKSCDKQISSWRHISCHTDKNRYYT